MIRFACPFCTRTLSAPDNRAGAKSKCPGCSQPVQVPAAPLPGSQSIIGGVVTVATTPLRPLILAIMGAFSLSLAIPGLCLATWLLAASDLREMREGRRDPGGRSLTEFARTAGKVSTLITAAALVVLVAWLAIGLLLLWR